MTSDPQSLSEMKAKNMELDYMIKSMETPGEEGEDVASAIDE